MTLWFVAQKRDGLVQINMISTTWSQTEQYE